MIFFFIFQYYNWITNAIKWKQKDPLFKIDIFCPNGKHESGVFIGIFSVKIIQKLKLSLTLIFAFFCVVFII